MVINLSTEQLADVIETHRQGYTKEMVEYCTGCNWVGAPINTPEYKENQYALHLAEMIQDADKPLAERRPTAWVDFEAILSDGKKSYVVVTSRQFRREPKVGQDVIAGDQAGHRAHGTVTEIGSRLHHPKNPIRIDLDMSTLVSPAKKKDKN